MRIKRFTLLLFSIVSTTPVVAETTPVTSQSSTGDQSPVIHSESDVNVNYYGLTEKQFADMLKAQAQRIVKSLQSTSADPDNKQRALLELELNAVHEKLVNLNSSYQQEKKRRFAADKALQLLKSQLPAEQLKKARDSLQQGNAKAAEKAFDNIVEKGSGAIALAAYQSGQLAEGRVDYAKAMHQYKTAVVLEENNPDYLFEAGQMAIITAEYQQAQHWLEQLLDIRQAEQKNDLNLASAQHALAYLYEVQGRYAEAGPLYQRAIKILRASFPDGHPDINTVQANYNLLKARNEMNSN
ncbi:MAG: tetratricopeptide repeat protein [Gammaproteobacteria bacterium]|nr:tetratricopeptide repeat protein [Gammaproteobacteria bacterium]